MKERTVRVYEVLADTAEDGPACDGTIVFRFRTARDAHVFASRHTCYGRPAKVTVAENIPVRIAQRWGMA